jgi:hypothetical protein
MDILSEDWKYPRVHVISPFPDCSSLHTAMSLSTALFLYLLILLKLIFIVGGAYHPAHVHIGKHKFANLRDRNEMHHHNTIL